MNLRSPRTVRAPLLALLLVTALGTAPLHAATADSHHKNTDKTSAKAAGKTKAAKASDKKKPAQSFPLPKGKSSVAQALASPENRDADDRFLAAREAVRKGDRATLARLAPELASHDLAVYLEYWRLTQSLSDGAEITPVLSFLNRYEGEYPAERLRISLIKELAKRGDWDGVSRETGKLVAPEQDTQCYGLQARLLHNDDSAIPAARKLWNEFGEGTEACQPVLDLLLARGKVCPEEIWSRAHHLAEINRTGTIRNTLASLPAEWRPEPGQLEQALERAPLWINQQNGNTLNSPASRQLLGLALQRIARNDPAHAASLLKNFEGNLNKDEKAQAWSHIALQAAKRLMPEARDWYRPTTPGVLTEDNVQWKVRMALRAQDWSMVRDTIEGMPAELASRPEWVYWLGRADKATGRRHEADALFNRIAGQPNFYGNLADEEMGRRIGVPNIARPATQEEMAQVGNRPGIRRALGWFRLDQRTEGVKEWNWALRGMNDRELLAAAELARRSSIYDRAISAADRTRQEHDYSLRYLAPFSDEVRSAARNQSIDDAWVYGLMRQESRFVTNARSNVGAAGLMQLMPATAKWVARKIGLKDYSHSQVHDTSTNLLLGTSYMRLVLENLDNHPVLASAAYNAGPGRARKWRGDTALEGAIYAESIPFNETRDYVKKVMSNAVYYSALFNGKPASLKERLGVIPARSGNDVLKDPDLP